MKKWIPVALIVLFMCTLAYAGTFTSYNDITTLESGDQFLVYDASEGSGDYLANITWGNLVTEMIADGSLLVSGGALGTPSSGTLTNATGLPVAGTLLAAGRSLTLSTNDLNADAELYTETQCIYIEDPTDADDLKSIWYTPIAVTLTQIWAESDQTVTFMLQVDDGSPADVDSVDLAPAAGVASDTSLNGDATMAAGDRLDIDLVSTSGTPTWVSICWTYTKDD